MVNAFGDDYALTVRAPGVHISELWASERNARMIARDYAKKYADALRCGDASIVIERVITVRNKQRREVIFSTGAPAPVESTEPTEYDRRTNYGAF